MTDRLGPIGSASALRKRRIDTARGSWLSLMHRLSNDFSLELQSIDQDLMRNSDRTNAYVRVRVWRQ